MITKNVGIALFSCFIGFASSCPAVNAGTMTLTGAVDDIQVGAGLRFEFGDNTVQLVGSARKTHTNTSNNVMGALADIAIPIFPATDFKPKVRIMGLAGSTTIQGLAGLGYDFGDLQPMISAGVQGPYVEGGVNILLDSQFKPYLGVNTFGDVPSSVILSP